MGSKITMHASVPGARRVAPNDTRAVNESKLGPIESFQGLCRKLVNMWNVEVLN